MLVYQRKGKNSKSLIGTAKPVQRLQLVYVKRRVRSNRVGGPRDSSSCSRSWFSRCLVTDGFLNNLTSSEKSNGDSSKSSDLLIDLNQTRSNSEGVIVESNVKEGIAELEEQQNCVSKNSDNDVPPTSISSTIIESDIAEAHQEKLITESDDAPPTSISSTITESDITEAYQKQLTTKTDDNPPTSISSTIMESDTAEAHHQKLTTESDDSIEANFQPQRDERNTQYQEFMCFGRKRKNDNKLDGRLQKKPKKKHYTPKVIGQGRSKKAPKVLNKSKTKRPPKPKISLKETGCEKKPTRTEKIKIPKLSTLKKKNTRSKRNHARQASPLKTCRRSLNFDKIEHNYVHNKVSNRERGVTNNSGLQSNSLQVFQKNLKLGNCLIESRKVHPTFSRACKKKRIQRWKTFSSRLKSCMFYSESRVFNIKFLRKKKRSNRTRRRSNMLLDSTQALERSESSSKRKSEMAEILEISTEVMEFLIDKLISKFLSMKIAGRRKGGKKGEKVNVSDNALVLYNRGDGKLALYQKPKKKKNLLVKVTIDEETLKVFNLLMKGKEHKEMDEDKRKYWEEERNMFRGRVDSFISRMHLIQGNRQFSPWKGSVMDSIAGVFLTQNVSDHLSSSAFIKLAATFPIQKTMSHEISNGAFETCNSQVAFGIGRNLLCFASEENVISNDSSKASTSSSNIHKPLGANLASNKETQNNIKRMNNKPPSPGLVYGKKKTAIPKKNEDTEESKRKEEEEKQYWTKLREIYTRPRHNDHMDSVDWEAVWKSPPNKVAEAIKGRGQHHIIADRILAFIKKLKETHGTIDVEWLREAPPNKVKEYLLKVYGLGLKSVECIRLLALQQIAFPVDVNVGRIVVRLGWVPLEPLPDHILIHNLEKFPLTDVIQKYLWPRLCTLNQRTLYELHYQMITFGKVFCTKANPNCNACPMKGECRHFASALESLQAKLPAPTTDNKPTETQIISSEVPTNFFPNLTMLNKPRSIFEVHMFSNSEYEVQECEPIIEMPTSPEPEFKDIEEFGEEYENLEDSFLEDDSEEIPTINLSSEGYMSNIHNFMDDQDDMKMSSALLALTANPASIPTRKMKNVSRLRTERVVTYNCVFYSKVIHYYSNKFLSYMLPDFHPLLEGFEIREPDDPSPYLLVIWSTGEIKNWCEESNIVPGTILIPCRTAMRGSFPLNGTYFQVNEMFADHHTSNHPIKVPTSWTWNLPQRIAFFGTSTTSIFRGLSVEKIQYCFWKGFVCVRAFDRMSRCPKPLKDTIHRNTTSQQGKKQGVKRKKDMEIKCAIKF